VTFANAGHLSPYLEGREIVLENGFPLGLVADCVYEETALTLDAGATLTLLTDGVVEARDRKGELFGFERTERISSEPAEAIVEAAQAFGQDDDITALTVKRLGWD
jgi:serine phosphatase RsbU (regulator of sigma subunit)